MIMHKCSKHQIRCFYWRSSWDSQIFLFLIPSSFLLFLLMFNCLLNCFCFIFCELHILGLHEIWIAIPLFSIFHLQFPRLEGKAKHTIPWYTLPNWGMILNAFCYELLYALNSCHVLVFSLVLPLFLPTTLGGIWCYTWLNSSEN